MLQWITLFGKEINVRIFCLSLVYHQILSFFLWVSSDRSFEFSSEWCSWNFLFESVALFFLFLLFYLCAPKKKKSWLHKNKNKENENTHHNVTENKSNKLDSSRRLFFYPSNNYVLLKGVGTQHPATSQWIQKPPR